MTVLFWSFGVGQDHPDQLRWPGSCARITGVWPPAIWCVGRYRQPPLSCAHRRRLGYIFQEGRLFPHMRRAAEPALRALVSRPRAASARDFGQIGRSARHRPISSGRPGALSGGEKHAAWRSGCAARRAEADPRESRSRRSRGAPRPRFLPYFERLRDQWIPGSSDVSHSSAGGGPACHHRRRPA